MTTGPCSASTTFMLMPAYALTMSAFVSTFCPYRFSSVQQLHCNLKTEYIERKQLGNSTAVHNISENIPTFPQTTHFGCNAHTHACTNHLHEQYGCLQQKHHFQFQSHTQCSHTKLLNLLFVPASSGKAHDFFVVQSAPLHDLTATQGVTACMHTMQMIIHQKHTSYTKHQEPSTEAS